MQQLREKAGLLEAPTLRAAFKGQQVCLNTLLCIFWNSSGVLHHRVSQMSLMSNPYAKYHKLSKVGKNYCSHYDKTSENCWPLRLEENARKHTANERKTASLH